MKKIAIPILGGKLSQHFGRAEKFVIYTVNNNTHTDIHFAEPPSHQPEIFPNWLNEQDVNVVITGGIGQRALTKLEQLNIDILSGVDIDDPQTLIQLYLDGSLETNINLCDH